VGHLYCQKPLQDEFIWGLCSPSTAAGNSPAEIYGSTHCRHPEEGCFSLRSLGARDSEATRRRRKEFLTAIAVVPAENLKFLDESGVTMQMTRLRGRASRGERVAEASRTAAGRY